MGLIFSNYDGKSMQTEEFLLKNRTGVAKKEDESEKQF